MTGEHSPGQVSTALSPAHTAQPRQPAWSWRALTQSHHSHPNTACCNPWHAACTRLAPDTPGDFRGSETGLDLSKLCLPSVFLSGSCLWTP